MLKETPANFCMGIIYFIDVYVGIDLISNLSQSFSNYKGGTFVENCVNSNVTSSEWYRQQLTTY